MRIILRSSGAAEAVLIVALLAAFFGPPVRAQSSAEAHPKASLSFDVASIKPSHVHFSDGRKELGGVSTPVFEVDHLTFKARGMNLFGLIIEAYGLRFCRPLVSDSCPMLTGGPHWLTTGTFDIDAKSSSGSTEYNAIQLRNGDAPQLQEELRNLLASRFHLKAHFEKRMLPVYAFTLADHGSSLKEASGAEVHSRIIFKSLDLPGGIKATQVIAAQASLQELADLYARFMDRPVIDATGLPGRYDFTVQYEVDAEATGPFAGVTAPSLFEAFENQVGLKLRATRRLVEVLVVDSAARPSPN